MAAVVGILGQDLLGVEPAWYLHGQKVGCLICTWCVRGVLGLLSSSSICILHDHHYLMP